MSLPQKELTDTSASQNFLGVFTPLLAAATDAYYEKSNMDLGVLTSTTENPFVVLFSKTERAIQNNNQ